MLSRRIAGGCVLACLLLGSSASAQSTTGAAPTRAARSAWQWTVELGREHDDNVLQLTRSGLDRFAIRPGPPRFLISDVGDWATTADLGARWTGRVLRRRDTRLSTTASFTHWDRDRVADWRQYSVGLNQELTSSRRHLLSAQLWLKHIPRYYLGEILDRDASLVAQTKVRNSLSYAQTAYGLGLAQELLGGRLVASGTLEREHRDYNANFPERDNDNEQFTLGLQVRPLRRGGPMLGLQWIQGDLNAVGEIPDTLDLREFDISHDHTGIEATLSQAWSNGVLRGRVDASYLREDRRYQTTDKYDINRFTRTNRRREAQIRITERLLGSSDVIVTWSRLSSEATYAVLSNVEPSTTDFAQEKFSVSLRTRW